MIVIAERKAISVAGDSGGQGAARCTMGSKKFKGKRPAQQQRIAAHVLPRTKQPSTIIGKQIKVLGAFWSGRQTAEEKATEYC